MPIPMSLPVQCDLGIVCAAAANYLQATVGEAEDQEGVKLWELRNECLNAARAMIQSKTLEDGASEILGEVLLAAFMNISTRWPTDKHLQEWLTDERAAQCIQMDLALVGKTPPFNDLYYANAASYERGYKEESDGPMDRLDMFMSNTWRAICELRSHHMDIMTTDLVNALEKQYHEVDKLIKSGKISETK